MDGRTPDSALPEDRRGGRSGGLERTVDRSGADEDLAALAQDLQSRQSDIHRRHFAQQLADLSAAMTNAVSELAGGSEVLVSAIERIPILPYRTAFLWVLPASRQVRRERR